MSLSRLVEPLRLFWLGGYARSGTGKRNAQSRQDAFYATINLLYYLNSASDRALHNAPTVGASGEILIRRANDNFERNPYCDCRKVSYRSTGQELEPSECEHLQNPGITHQTLH